MRERTTVYQYDCKWLWSIYKEKSRTHENRCYGDMRVRRRHANEELGSSLWNQEKKALNWTQELGVARTHRSESDCDNDRERGTSCDSMQTVWPQEEAQDEDFTSSFLWVHDLLTMPYDQTCAVHGILSPVMLKEKSTQNFNS